MRTGRNALDLVGHWETVHERVGPRGGSWYQAEPRMSLALIQAFAVAKDTPIIDVGAGSSRLVDELIQRGFSDISVLDVSARALQLARARLGEAASRVRWLREDLLDWEPPRAYGIARLSRILATSEKSRRLGMETTSGESLTGTGNSTPRFVLIQAAVISPGVTFGLRNRIPAVWSARASSYIRPRSNHF